MRVSIATLRIPGRFIWPPLLALTLVAASACGGGADAGGGKAASGVGAGPITVTMKELTFEPKELTVPVGKAVSITAKNSSAAIHNMQVLSKDAEGKDFQSATVVNPGAESKFEVKFTKAGTYKFQCLYHLPDMVGTITAK